MKKLLFLISGVLLLSGCGCVLSQVPPQIVYAGSGCTAPLPDYKTQVMVTGGCFGFTVTQTPSAGTLLTASNKTANVVIKALGANGKSSQINFTVTLLDTITPKITPIGSLVAYRVNQMNEVYNAGDKISASIRSLSNTFPYANFLGKDKAVDSTLKDNILVILSKNNNRIMTYSNEVGISMFLNSSK